MRKGSSHRGWLTCAAFPDSKSGRGTEVLHAVRAAFEFNIAPCDTRDIREIESLATRPNVPPSTAPRFLGGTFESRFAGTLAAPKTRLIPESLQTTLIGPRLDIVTKGHEIRLINFGIGKQ